MLTPEEVIERRRYLGASDAGAVIGVNPYSSAWDVYAEKVGIEIDKSEMEDRFWWGSAIEEIIARRFAEKKGVELVKPEPVVHPRFPWLRASPDGFILEGGQPVGGFEAKTVTTFQDHLWGVEGTDEVPPHVRVQCEIGMACTGLPWWYVAALFGTFEMKTYRVLRADAEYEAALIQALGGFWFGHVVPQVPPPMDGSDGARAWLRAMYPRDDRDPRPAATVEELEAIESFLEARSAEKAAIARMATAKNVLASHIADAGGIKCSKGTIFYRANKRGIRSFRVRIEGVEG